MIGDITSMTEAAMLRDAIAGYQTRGEPVPDEISLALRRWEAVERLRNQKGITIKGAPRPATERQTAWIAAMLRWRDVPDDTRADIGEKMRHNLSVTEASAIVAQLREYPKLRTPWEG